MRIGGRLNDPGLRKLIVSVLLVTVLSGIQGPLWSWITISAQALHDRRTISQQISNLNEQVQLLQQEQTSQVLIDEQLAVVLIEEAEISQAVERIESIAQGLGITLTIHGIHRETVPEKESIAPLVITATAIGAVDKLLQYLEAIEHVAEITSIQDFVLTPAAKTPATINSNNFSLSLNVVFVGQAPAKVATADDAAENRFETNTNPAPPQDITSRLSRILLVASFIGLLGLVIYKFIRKRRKE